MVSKNIYDYLIRYSHAFILISFVIVLTIGFWLKPFNLPSTNDEDALLYMAMGYLFKIAIHTYNEFPIWNPYFGGGIPWSGFWNPGISPVSLILILFGEVVGIKVWLFATYLLGALGMYQVCLNCLSISRSSSVLAGMLFVGSLWAAGRFESGNYFQFSYLLLPLCIYLFYCLSRGSFVGFLLPLLYWTILAAFGKYEIFLMIPFILVFALAYRKIFEVSAGRILSSFVISFIVFIGLGMSKLLPLLEEVSVNIANFYDYESYAIGFTELIKEILIVEITKHRNYNVGVGYSPVIFVIAAFFIDWRKSMGLCILLIVSILLTIGPDTPLIHITKLIP
ncbi:MAG: hypothetical protein ACW99Q_22940, partial [Candidatus Kariarchaeaceae archaeon]